MMEEEGWKVMVEKDRKYRVKLEEIWEANSKRVEMSIGEKKKYTGNADG